MEKVTTWSLPDDPDQQHPYSYGYNNNKNNNSYNNNNNSYNNNDYNHHGRGRGGRFGDTNGRQGSFQGPSPGRYNGRGYDRDSYPMDTTRTTRREYDDNAYNNNVNNHSDRSLQSYNDHGRRYIKNPKSQGLTKSRFVIGGDSDDAEVLATNEAGSSSNLMELEDTVIIPQTYNEELHQIERMEGVISLDGKESLVVMDGANVAYAYADAMSAVSGTHKREPDYRGLLVAANYFLQWDIRVLIVLPAPWFRLKPRAGDTSSGTCVS